LFASLLQTLQGQLKDAKAGRRVDESEIPPVVKIDRQPATQPHQPQVINRWCFSQNNFV